MSEDPKPLPEGFQRVTSSNLEAVAYFPPEQVNGENEGSVQVIFKNGHRWKYSKVPREVFEQMLAAESVGKFYNAEIKGNELYEAQKVELQEQGE